MTLVGPLFRHELTRLARRGLQPKLRAVFVALLGAALLFTYLRAFPGVSPVKVLVNLDEPLSIDQASRFGETFLIAFLVVQLVVVVVVTPVLVGGSMAEEKERGSLDFLLSSPLTSREIVLGKLLARSVYVAGIALAGLPVLTVTMFFGGVDASRLLAGYAITLLTIPSLGAFSLYLAVVSEGLRPVLLWSYGSVTALTVTGYCFCCCIVPIFFSPFSTITFVFVGDVPSRRGWISDPLVLIGGYSACHLPLTVIFLWRAMAHLREAIRRLPKHLRSRPGYAIHRDDDLPPLRDRPLRSRARPIEHADRSRRVSPLPPHGNPLAWKERWFGGRLWPAYDSPLAILLLGCGGLVVMYLTAITANVLERDNDAAEVYGPVGRTVAAITVPGLVLASSVLVAGSVARERQRQTLEPLLMLPVSRQSILRAKAGSVIRSGWPLAAIIAAFLLIGIATGGVTLSALMIAPVLVAGWSGFAVGFGMWLSVRCPTPARATGFAIGTVLALCLAPAMISPLVRASMANPQESDAVMVEAVIDGFSPMTGGWNALAAPDAEAAVRSMLPRQCLGAALGAATMGLLGGGFWLAASRRFEHEGR